MSDHEALAILLEQSSGELRQKLAELVEWLRSRWTDEEIAQYIEAHQFDFAHEHFTSAGQSLAADVAAVYTAAGQFAVDQIRTSTSELVSFNVSSPIATQQISHLRTDLIRQFTADQEEVVRQVLMLGFERGINPVQQARLIRQSIGLTPYQASIVQNFRRSLEMGSERALQYQLRDRRHDPKVRSAAAGTRVLSPESIDDMVERYRQNMINFRAEIITRHQALRALHEGYNETFRQLVESGRFSLQDFVCTWHTAGDEKVRTSHSFMSGQKRPFGQPFLSGDGVSLRYPGDADAPAKEVLHCRCVETISVLHARTQVV